MGKLYKSNISGAFSSNYDIQSNKPFDLRTVVDKKYDLVNPATWQARVYGTSADAIPTFWETNFLNCYTGLVVFVKSEKSLYFLLDAAKYNTLSDEDYYYTANDISIANFEGDYNNLHKTSSGYSEYTFITAGEYALLAADIKETYTKVSKDATGGWKKVGSEVSGNFTTLTAVQEYFMDANKKYIKSSLIAGAQESTLSCYYVLKEVKTDGTIVYDLSPVTAENPKDTATEGYMLNLADNKYYAPMSSSAKTNTTIYAIKDDCKKDGTTYASSGDVYRWTGELWIKVSSSNDGTRITTLESLLTWKTLSEKIVLDPITNLTIMQIGTSNNLLFSYQINDTFTNSSFTNVYISYTGISTNPTGFTTYARIKNITKEATDNMIFNVSLGLHVSPSWQIPEYTIAQAVGYASVTLYFVDKNETISGAPANGELLISDTGTVVGLLNNLVTNNKAYKVSSGNVTSIPATQTPDGITQP